MASIVFNQGLGRIRALAEQVGVGNAALVVVPLEAAGMVADATMRDYPTLAALLAGPTNEQVTMGRKTVTAATVTVNDTDNRVEVDFADQTWAAATGNPVGGFLVCFDPDTTAGTDADIIPLTKHDLSTTPDGLDLLLQVADFYRSSDVTA